MSLLTPISKPSLLVSLSNGVPPVGLKSVESQTLCRCLEDGLSGWKLLWKNKSLKCCLCLLQLEDVEGFVVNQCDLK